MGEVYRAHDPRLERDVAIKVLPEDLASDPDRLHRLEREAKAAGALNHPNILAVYDTGTHEGSPYVVTEKKPADLGASSGYQRMAAVRRRDSFLLGRPFPVHAPGRLTAGNWLSCSCLLTRTGISGSFRSARTSAHPALSCRPPSGSPTQPSPPTVAGWLSPPTSRGGGRSSCSRIPGREPRRECLSTAAGPQPGGRTDESCSSGGRAAVLAYSESRPPVP